MVNQPKIIPNTPGVYTFSRGHTPLYIGKATDLKKRLTSYFSKNAGEKVRRLTEEATRLEWIETESEAEALIKESELIKKYRPKFNILMRDDKSYFYVAFTREEFPRILTLHKTALDGSKYKRVIGPFTSGSALRTTLKLLRRIFPYCTCKSPHKRPCLNAQIGRCLGFCCLTGTKHHPTIVRTSLAAKNAYQKNIRGIIVVLSGRKTRLLSQLKQEMRAASKAEDYERAAKIRDQINGLDNIFSHRSLLNYYRGETSTVKWESIQPVIRRIAGGRKKISRVEGYDISNISGTHATGSMIVFIDGRSAKSAYRKFRIKTVPQANDVAMHREVIRRRLARPEWPYPQLMLIDGGKPQLNAAIRELRITDRELQIRIAALAKREEELYIEGKPGPVRLDSLPAGVMHFFQRVRDESHRFAKKYHHKLREISYREQGQKIKN